MSNVKVAIRCRPLNKREQKFHQEDSWLVNGNTMSQLTHNGKPVPGSSFSFGKFHYNFFF